MVCGSGGVGKTTTAAALGLKAAFQGRRVLVCTVDPARRLATSLGLRLLDEQPRRLDLSKLAANPGGEAPDCDTAPNGDKRAAKRDSPPPGGGEPGARARAPNGDKRAAERDSLPRSGGGPGGGGAAPPSSSAELWAMMLDTKRTFDALVERYAPDATARERILQNRFYRQVSSALAGSHEYMAMEKLLELSGDERFDLIILDTPPTSHALDFLEAPDRLVGFLDASILRWFLRPYFVAGQLTVKVVGRTGGVVLKLVDRVLGLQFLQDLSEFFLAFESMYAGFKERAARVYELLRGPDTGFLVVAAPRATSLDEARHFHARLREKEMPFVSFIVNRVRSAPAAVTASARRKARPPDAELLAPLLRVHEQQRSLARLDRQAIARLKTDAHADVVAVPELESDVHDLRGLREVAEALFGTALDPGARARAARA